MGNSNNQFTLRFQLIMGQFLSSPDTEGKKQKNPVTQNESKSKEASVNKVKESRGKVEDPEPKFSSEDRNVKAKKSKVTKSDRQSESEKANTSKPSMKTKQPKKRKSSVKKLVCPVGQSKNKDNVFKKAIKSKK